MAAAIVEAAGGGVETAGGGVAATVGGGVATAGGCDPVARRRVNKGLPCFAFWTCHALFIGKQQKVCSCFRKCMMANKGLLSEKALMLPKGSTCHRWGGCCAWHTDPHRCIRSRAGIARGFASSCSPGCISAWCCSIFLVVAGATSACKIILDFNGGDPADCSSQL